MKTLILFSSNHACPEKIAIRLKNHLQGDITLINLDENREPELDDYDSIIIGTSAGTEDNGDIITRYCVTNHNKLVLKELGLFVICNENGIIAQLNFERIFPAGLIERAKSTAVFNSDDIRDMEAENKIRDGFFRSDNDRIRKFSSRMNRIFNPFMFLA